MRATSYFQLKETPFENDSIAVDGDPQRKVTRVVPLAVFNVMRKGASLVVQILTLRPSLRDLRMIPASLGQWEDEGSPRERFSVLKPQP